MMTIPLVLLVHTVLRPCLLSIALERLVCLVMTEEWNKDVDWTMISVMKPPSPNSSTDVYCFQCATRTNVAFYMDIASDLRGHCTTTSYR